MALEGDGGSPIRTPDQRLRVFVSSTLAELAEERAAVRRAIESLGLSPVMFELGARPHPPAELYQAYLRQSHVFVGLYWQSYGWVAPDMEISGLEDEWRLATDHPKLVYIKEPAPERDAALSALLGLVLATVILHERLPAKRITGALVIVAGLVVIGGEAITTIGVHGVAGDSLFMLAGAFFATFGMFLRKWRVIPTRAMIVTSVVSLVDLPIHWLLFGFERMIALGLLENLLQAVVQGIFAGALSTYLFTRAVVLLGDPGRSYFPKSGVKKLKTYKVQTTRDLEDREIRETSVYQLLGKA